MRFLLASWAALALLCPAVRAMELLPAEPVEIGGEPQFVLDNYVIDNYWAIKYHRQLVRRVFHAPVKHEANPLIAGEGGYVCTSKDEEAGLVRMWYATSIMGEDPDDRQTAIAYADSKDGIDWQRPSLGLFEWKGTTDNNIVWRGSKGKRATSNFLLLDIPERDRRGYRYLMTYLDTDGIRLIGSQDGVHWEADTHLKKLHSDTENSPLYDPACDQYVMYCRAKHVYRTFQGEILDTGESRRIARMTSKSLWDPWESDPQNILLPDELDFRDGFNAMYGMPTRYYGHMFWGFVWLFRFNDHIHTELAWSRDGISFDRMPERPKFLARGDDGAWDDGMVFASSHWIEMGDQWWFYYAGWDGPHGTRGRTPGIGLATLRKEGFVSMRGPSEGGVLATRAILWPGGTLVVNADAHEGELKVRVSDERRKPLSGFDYDDCLAFAGDSVAHEVRWNEKSLADLAGQVIRIEFYLEDADLYTFRANPDARQAPAAR